jgi:hypothetical protein
MLNIELPSYLHVCLTHSALVCPNQGGRCVPEFAFSGGYSDQIIAFRSTLL